jgi:tetratricopeptide (TPR) repeat protein
LADPLSRDAEAVTSEARALLDRDQPSEAAQLLRMHLQQHAGTAAEYMLLGVALSNSDEGLMALETFEQAVALEPENAAAHYNLGQAYREFGRDREALREWESALRLRPGYPAAVRAIAEIRRQSVPTENASPADNSAPEEPIALASLRADEIIRREREKPPRAMIAVLTVLVLGLIGLLAQPYLPAGVGLVVLIFEFTMVVPLVLWCVSWLQIQSLRRKEEKALRRGDIFGAAVAQADRRMYERFGGRGW